LNYSIRIIALLVFTSLVGCSGDEPTAANVNPAKKDTANTSSSLPALHLHTDSKSVTNTQKGDCFIELVLGDKSQWLVEGKVKTRGIMAGILKYEKKSYSIKFKKKQGILGLTASKEYVLNASYTDKTFMRNHLAYAFFRRSSPNSYAPEQRFIELYLDNEYRGLYLLTERVDEKHLGLADSGALFKAPGLFMTMDDSFYHHHRRDDHWEQRFPKLNKEDRSLRLEAFLELVHHSTDEEFSSQIEDYVDLEHVMEWEITLLMANNSTGVFKNYYLYQKEPDGQYFFALWDADRGFGRDDDYELNLDGFMDVNRNEMLRRLQSLNVSNYNGRLAERWMRGDWAAKKYIAYIDELQSELHPFIARNAARWPNDGEYYTDANDFSAEVQLLRDWLEKREPAVNSFVIESQ
jgi:hypothetical protein